MEAVSAQDGSSPKERVTRAIATEEAAARLETARAALLDAATEVAADIYFEDGRWVCAAGVLESLCCANDEWQDAQLQAYAPEEAEGLAHA